MLFRGSRFTQPYVKASFKRVGASELALKHTIPWITCCEKKGFAPLREKKKGFPSDAALLLLALLGFYTFLLLALLSFFTLLFLLALFLILLALCLLNSLHAGFDGWASPSCSAPQSADEAAAYAYASQHESSSSA